MPSVFRHFVTADVKIFVGEHFTKFVNNIFNEFIGRVLTCAQNIVLNSPVVGNRQLSVNTAILAVA